MIFSIQVVNESKLIYCPGPHDMSQVQIELASQLPPGHYEVIYNSRWVAEFPESLWILNKLDPKLRKVEIKYLEYYINRSQNNLCNHNNIILAAPFGKEYEGCTCADCRKPLTRKAIGRQWAYFTLNELMEYEK